MGLLLYIYLDIQKELRSDAHKDEIVEYLTVWHLVDVL